MNKRCSQKISPPPTRSPISERRFATNTNTEARPLARGLSISRQAWCQNSPLIAPIVQVLCSKWVAAMLLALSGNARVAGNLLGDGLATRNCTVQRMDPLII